MNIKLNLALAVVFAGALCLPAQAALPPYWQRAAELQAIASDRVVAETLERKGQIEAIEATGPDAYVVRAGGCSLEVSIVDAPATGEPVVGPRQFTVEVGTLTCP